MTPVSTVTTAWRSSSGAAKDRNRTYHEADIARHTEWRSFFGTAEDRDFGSSAVTSAWMTVAVIFRGG
jgi:hypothetical protein